MTIDTAPGALTVQDRSVVYAYAAGDNYIAPFEVAEYDDLGDAFNAAYQVLSDNIGYGTVVLPPTDEAFGTQMVADGGGYIDIVGRGMAATKPIYSGEGAALLLDGCSRFEARDFAIRGDDGPGQDGIRLYTGNSPMSHFALRNITINGTGRYGIFEEVANGNDIFDYCIDTIYLTGMGNHAIYSPSGDGGTASKLYINIHALGTKIGGDFIHDEGAGIQRNYIGCHSEGVVQGTGYYIQDGVGHLLLGCRAEGQGGDGAYLRNVTGMTVQNFIGIAAGGIGFHAYGDYDGCKFDRLHVTGSATKNFEFADNGTVEDNRLGWTNLRDPTMANLEQDEMSGRVGTVNGGVTADITIGTSENYITADTSSAAVTLTLDTPAFEDLGREVKIADEGGNAGTNAITIDTAGSETVDGGTASINENYGQATVMWTGSNWVTV